MQLDNVSCMISLICRRIIVELIVILGTHCYSTLAISEGKEMREEEVLPISDQMQVEFYRLLKLRTLNWRSAFDLSSAILERDH